MVNNHNPWNPPFGPSPSKWRHAATGFTRCSLYLARFCDWLGCRLWSNFAGMKAIVLIFGFAAVFCILEVGKYRGLILAEYNIWLDVLDSLRFMHKVYLGIAACVFVVNKWPPCCKWPVHCLILSGGGSGSGLVQPCHKMWYSRLTRKCLC